MLLSLRWFMILERVFLGVLIGTALYIIYFYTTHHNQNYMIARSSAAKTIQIKIPEMPSYDTYYANIKKRDLFSSLINSADLAGLSAATVASGFLPSNFKVVGIVLSKPAEVILEDTNSKQTIFIKQGQAQNGIGIDRVDGKQVTLNYQGQQIQIGLKENR